MEAFTTSRIKKSDYGKVVLASKLLLRHGIVDLLHLASTLQIPLSIVSGGLKEIIQATFYAIFFNGEIQSEDVKSYFIDEEHVRVIANTFEYDEDHKAVDYHRPIIHSMNKREFLYKDEAPATAESVVKKEIYHRRKNVMVMGDILDDVRMVKENSHGNVLKVGFLNESVTDEKTREEYMDTYDLVIMGDGSLDPVNHILKQNLFWD